jgi:hypothetical protein
MKYSNVLDHPFDGSNETAVEVKDGDEITIVFENNSHMPVNLTILDLQPLWGITQIYPEVTDYEEIDPGARRELQLEVTRPPGITSRMTVDTIKAFVTVDRTSFRALEMDDIDISPDTESPAERHGSISLQSLLDRLLISQGQIHGSSAGGWETREISVRVCDIDAEEETARQIVKQLLTVVATGRRDLVILPSSSTTISDKMKEIAMTFLNLGASRFLRTPRETQHSPIQRRVMWRCVSTVNTLI